MKCFFAMAIAGCAVAAKVDRNDIEFIGYLAKYNKDYNSMDQYNMRKDRYMETGAEIERLNSSQTSSRHGHNKFSDWTKAEWQAILLENYTPSDPGQFKQYEPRQSNGAPPDWYSQGYLGMTGPLEDFTHNVNGDTSFCKASYAFAAAGLMEIRR